MRAAASIILTVFLKEGRISLYCDTSTVNGFLPILQRTVILNKVFIAKFPVIVVVYVATSLVNKDEFTPKP